MIRLFFSKRYSIIPVIIFSSICYFLSTGLQGDFWFLLWIAPVPILLYSYYNSGISTFLIAAAIFLISKINLLAYWIKVLTPSLAFSLILILSVLSACIFLLNKIISSKLKEPFAIFVFPLLYTSVEFLESLILPDISLYSLAYTQADNTLIIQIAALTGMYGVTFFISLFASCFAYLILIKANNSRFYSFIAGPLILLLVPVYGIVRMNPISNNNDIHFKAACIRVDSLSHGENIFNSKNGNLVFKEYSNLIDQNIKERIDCILLPEKMIELHQEEKSNYYPEFSAIASDKNAIITAGFKIKNKDRYENIAAVFFPNGKTIMEYQKKYLVPGWESKFDSGDKLLIFKYKELNIGAAICKDMDFPGWIRKYSSIDIMLAPSWDFQEDNWMHSRPAIFRGVENGFTMIRSAREGDLTISGPYGNIIKQAVYDKKDGEDILMADIYSVKLDTLYSKFGDWFCWLSMIILAFFAFFSIFKVNLGLKKRI